MERAALAPERRKKLNEEKIANNSRFVGRGKQEGNPERRRKNVK